MGLQKKNETRDTGNCKGHQLTTAPFQSFLLRFTLSLFQHYHSTTTRYTHIPKIDKNFTPSSLPPSLPPSSQETSSPSLRPQNSITYTQTPLPSSLPPSLP